MTHDWADVAFIPGEPGCWQAGIRFRCRRCSVERRVAGEVTFYVVRGKRVERMPECTA